ncbi:MAG: hypothetical protein BHW12_02340 [Coprobacillus sp. 28_7]|nr:MAG: hypothetical protein BHW12_02340 [Coprobacillus sp. 28_7]
MNTKIMKKILSSIIVMIVCALFIGCKKNPKEKIRVLLPQGTPLVAVGNLLDDEMFSFDIVNGQDPLIEAFTKGEYDLLIAPLNLGTKLNIAKKSEYKLKAIITTNNTYLVSKNEFKNIEEVNGKNVLGFGEGSTPSLALNSIMNYKNLTPKKVDFRSSAADVTLEYTSKNTEYDFFLLAEPNISIISNKTKKEVYKISLSDLLKDEVDMLIQACLFVNPNKNIDDKAINKIEENIKEMNNNPSDYAKSVESKHNFFEGLTKEVLEKAIPNCNITFINAKDNKNIIESYYKLLDKFQPSVLQGKRPDENFII